MKALRKALELLSVFSIGLACFTSMIAAQTTTSEATDWQDGYSLIVLNTKDIQGCNQAREFVVSQGGSIAIASPPHALLGWIPADVEPKLVGKMGIVSIHHKPVDVSTFGFTNIETVTAIRFFNHVASGALKAEQTLAAKKPHRGKPLTDDAVPHPPINRAAYEANLRRFLATPLPATPSAGTSDSMTGTVAVAFFFIQSNGKVDTSLYNWTAAEEQDLDNRVYNALTWWSDRADHYRYSVTFTYQFYSSTDSRTHQDYEPVLHPHTDDALWVSEVMANFGYTTGDNFSQVSAFNTWFKGHMGADSAFSVFVACDNPANSTFTDGWNAFAYFGGPYLQMLYYNDGWDYTDFGLVLDHEMGHIFWACDEYHDSETGRGCTSCDPCDSPPGRSVPNGNCETCNPNAVSCIMRDGYRSLCSFTPLQIGWLPYGSVQVFISPQAAIDAGAQWRVDGGAWTGSGTVISHVTTGGHTVDFKPVFGWDQPSAQTVTISQNSTTSTNAIYTRQTGSLQVTITPQGAVSAGAKWRVDGGDWQDSGIQVAGLSMGSHLVDFSTIAGWDTPTNLNENISKGQLTTDTVTYARQTGSLEVTINPWCAVEGGAMWQADDGPWQVTGSVIWGLPTGQYTVHFNSLPSGTSPSDQLVTINNQLMTTVSGTYTQSIAPNPPSSLTATLVSPMQVHLSWQDNSDIETGFKIERAESADGPWAQIARVLPNTTKFWNTGLFPSKTYYYRVCAYNCAGDSDFCDQVSANTPASLCSSVVGWGYGQATPPDGLSNVVAIAGGLALKSDGTVVGWGYYGNGKATPPPGLSNVVAIAAGGEAGLALKSDGTVLGWGSCGEACDPTPPNDLSNVVAIAVSWYNCLALKSDGTVVSWSSYWGQPPARLGGVVAIASGFEFRLALKSDGTVVGWGRDVYGQTDVPPDLTNAVAIAAGQDHSLALKSDGTVVGWGDNGVGEATPPDGLSNVVAIAASDFYSLALKSGGTVVGWGNDVYGETDVPAGLSNVVAIAAVGSFAIACAPNPPSALTATAVFCSTEIDLSWRDNSNNESGFIIERSTDGSNFSQIDTVGNDVTTYQDIGLDVNIVYYYRVRAFIGDLNSDYSNTADAQTPVTGYLEVGITPQCAVDGGAMWQMDGGPWQESGSTVCATVGQHTVHFSALSTAISPSDQLVTIDIWPTTMTNGNYSLIDTDRDLIPDCWMMQYFGHPTGLGLDNSRASDDADGTGQNNLFKYVAGLDPTNPASVFVLQIQNVPNQPTRKNLIYGPIANGCTYAVESTTDLVAGTWSPQAVSVPLTNGAQVTVMDPNATAPFKFYRVHIYNTVTNIVVTDSVGDSIPDSWRAQYFPTVDPTGVTTNSASCATCDADGTGQNNLFKYVAGLDPTNPASVFLLNIASVLDQITQQSLLFNPVATGRTYTPQFTTNLTIGNWSPLTGYVGPVTNGSQVTITDTNAIGLQKFYRIDISLP